MLCNNCRCKIENGDTICKNCGAPIENQGNSFFQQASDLGAPSDRDVSRTGVDSHLNAYPNIKSEASRVLEASKPPVRQQPVIPYAAPGSQSDASVPGVPGREEPPCSAMPPKGEKTSKKGKVWLIVLVSVLLAGAIGVGAYFGGEQLGWWGGETTEQDSESENTPTKDNKGAKGKKGQPEYVFDENYVYNDEMRAHVLKSTTPRVWVDLRAEISYPSVVLDDTLLQSDLGKVVQPEMDEVLVSETVETYISENIVSYLRFGDRRTEKVRFGAGHGSGVVISEDGYIATNAHVATIGETEKQASCASVVYDEALADLSEIFTHIEMTYGVSLSYEKQLEIAQMVCEDTASKIRILNEDDSKIVVQFPTADGKTGDDDANEYEAKLVAHGTQEGEEGLVMDVAIIKIKEENLVALPLASEYPETNSQITTAGFPANSEYIFQDENRNSASALSVTITDGKIARVFPIDGLDYKGIEITSTISGGNSGGPSVNNYLYVLGLNTYGLTEDMRYAYMVSSLAVTDLAEEEGLEIGSGEISAKFLTGIQCMQNGEYEQALSCFEEVQQLQPDTPYIEELIEKTEKKIKK